MEAASAVITAEEAVALAEETEVLDPLRTAEPGQATEADEPLTLGSDWSPLMIKHGLLVCILVLICFAIFASLAPKKNDT